MKHTSSRPDVYLHAGPLETLFGQLQRQTCGWKESLAHIRETVQRRGAYDGILAFSQGCAMALLLLAAAELACTSTTACPDEPSASLQNSSGDSSSTCDQARESNSHDMHATSTRGAASSGASCSRSRREEQKESFGKLSEELQQEIRSFAQHNPTSFKFALLFSGHRGVCPEAQSIIEAAAPLATPSMHVYGAPGQDQQVPYEASAELPGLFQDAKVVVHGKGHVAPSSKADCQLYLEFAAAAMQ